MTRSPHIDEDARVAFGAAQAAGDRRAALALATAAIEAGASRLDVYLDLIEPAQHDLGRRWASGELSVADEHVATAVSEFVVHALTSRTAPRDANSRGRAVVTGVTGEVHELGPRMVADVLEGDGWEVRFLGTDAPHGDVVDAIARFRPDLLCVSVTMLEHIESAARIITDARQQLSAVRVIVGGQAFSAWDDLWRRAGADALATDARRAITVARELTAP